MGGSATSAFNGGCEYNTKPTGWEPGSGLGGRPKKLFTLLGGDPRQLPLDDLLREGNTYDRRGRKVETGKASISRHFEPVELPEGSVPLLDPTPEAREHPGYRHVLDYLWSRGEHVATSYEYHWCPGYSRYLIVPYLHHGRVVGWLGRAAVDGIPRFVGRSPGDYIFGQDRAEWSQGRASLVMEGVMDAIAVQGLAIRNSRPTENQMAFLRLCGQDIIVLPDQEAEGLALVEVAAAEGWRVSIPEWDPGVKDVCQAVNRYGLLYATESIVAGASRNYHKARLALMLKG